jgi:hypothetical protein
MAIKERRMKDEKSNFPGEFFAERLNLCKAVVNETKKSLI